MGTAARASNGAPRVTSLPDAAEFLEWQKGIEKEERARAAKVGRYMVWAAKHWAKVVGLGLALLGAWQWNDARIESNVLAAQAEEHQAKQVKELVVARDANTEVNKEQNANIEALQTQVGVSIEMSQTTLEVLGKQGDVKRALARDRKLAVKVEKALAVDPRPRPKAQSAAGAL